LDFLLFKERCCGRFTRYGTRSPQLLRIAGPFDRHSAFFRQFDYLLEKIRVSVFGEENLRGAIGF